MKKNYKIHQIKLNEVIKGLPADCIKYIQITDEIIELAKKKMKKELLEKQVLKTAYILHQPQL